MNRAGWCYVSGACVARETAFLAPRQFEELASLSPAEASARLVRTFFGPVAPLSAFDAVARRRRNEEFDYIAKLSPAPWPVDLVRIRYAADVLRGALSEVTESTKSRLLALARRAGRFADDFAEYLSEPLPEVTCPARLKVSLLIDRSELLVTRRLAHTSGDDTLIRWTDAKVAVAAALFARRAVALRLPKEAVGAYFFSGELAGGRAGEFLADYDERAAARLLPDGAAAGAEEAYLRLVASVALGELASPGRVLYYLLLFLEQVGLLRGAVYRVLGKLLPKEAAA